MMEMHTAQLPDGRFIYIIGSNGDWRIWVSGVQYDESVEVEQMGRCYFEGIQSLASAELILEETFGARI